MQEPESRGAGSLPQGAERVVYIVADEPFSGGGHADGDIELRDVWQALWRGKWVIAAVTALGASVALAYALLATEWWRSEAVLAPVEDKNMPAIAGQLGGLAALAGLNLGGSGNSVDALAILRSREFASDFIEDRGLVPVLFADEWDADRGAWRSADPRKHRDVRDAVKKFHKDVLRVSQDRQTKIVTLTVEWTDADLAAQWARGLVDRVNERMRERALRRAEGNLAYLQAELAKTNVVTLQQSIGRIMESEMQSLMLARGNTEFAFRVLDPPNVPKFQVRPRRLFVVVLGTLVGGVLGVIAVLTRRFALGSAQNSGV